MITLRQKLLLIFLWLSVINLSIWIGGTMFHMIVVLPIWSQPLPGSVTDFFGGTRAYEYLLDFYGPSWMIIRIAPIVICLLFGWNSKRHRYFISITLLMIAFGIILSFIVVYPINEAIMANAGEGKSTDEIERMVHTWILADRLRFAAIFVGYCFLLWAFRLPIQTENR